MAKAETMSTRSPRGTKPVSEAFFAALARIPAASRAVVAKAAQTMIRDELKTQRDKAKTADVKQKAVKVSTAGKAAVAKQPVRTKSSAKTAAIKKASAPAPRMKSPKAATPAQAKKAAGSRPEAKRAETATVA